MAHSTTFPSPSQLISLSALPQQAPSLPPPTSVLFSPLIPLLTNPDVFPYVTTHDPLHIPPLSSPSLFNTSFTFKMSCTRAPPFSQLPTPYLISHYDTELLFCPAFNTGPLTIGVGVMGVEVRTAPSFFALSQFPTGRDTHNFRFVADADRTLFMLWCDLADQNAILCFYAQCQDTRTTRAVSFVFNREMLLSILEEKGPSLTSADLQPALHLYQDEYERHACSKCADTSVISCACAYNLERGAHPMDTRQFSNALEPHCGPAECVLNQVVFEQGRGVRHDVLGSRAMFAGVLDHAMVQRLADWSLKDFVTSIVEGPRRTLTIGDRDAKWDFKAVTGDVLVPICAGCPIEGAEMEVTEIDIGDSREGAEGSGDTSEISGGVMEANLENCQDVPCMLDAREDRLNARRKLLADRRARNRASAQRSNRKRKLAMDILQGELQSGKERLSVLRQREMALRKENLELRKLVP